MNEENRITLPDGPPIPEMREAVLSCDDVDALTADLSQHTQIQSVIGKGGPRQHSSETLLTLSDAVAQLVARTLPAIQIRYGYDGFDWTDTLIHTPHGIKLVRCQHDSTVENAR